MEQEWDKLPSLGRIVLARAKANYGEKSLAMTAAKLTNRHQTVLNLKMSIKANSRPEQRMSQTVNPLHHPPGIVGDFATQPC